MDLKELERKYKGLQKKLHPDLFTRKSEVCSSRVVHLLQIKAEVLQTEIYLGQQRERSYSADQSSHVIQAYHTLVKPLQRARYMVRLPTYTLENHLKPSDDWHAFN